MNKKRIVIFASGRGSNAEAIHEACENGTVNGEVVGVICDHAGAQVLERARRWNVPSTVIELKSFENKAAFNDALLEAAVSYKPDLICLAGYMRICGENLIHAFPNRIINIHPALIPAFCGPGMYGHHVHEAVLAYGAKISGATTHFVDEQVDHGGVIMQKSVPVLEGDTPETLAARVLTVEHEILPESVRLFCAEKLGVDGRQVHVL